MANLSTSVPSQLRGMVYLYTPIGQPRFWNRIYLNLAASTYNRMQISVFENSVTRGDARGNVESKTLLINRNLDTLFFNQFAYFFHELIS